MANIKISELTALTPPDAADLVPVTDSSASQTKRTTVGEIVGIINGDVEVANNGTATISELPVSKLQDGAARQLLQTDAAGTGVEWTSNVDVPGTLDVTGATTLDSTLTVPLGSAAAPTLRFSGDANTGVYSPGADQVAISTNGTGRLFVDASGKIGAGTSSISAKLHVSNGNSSVTPNTNADEIFVENNGNAGITIGSPNTGNCRISFGDPEDAQAGLIFYDHTANYLRFDTAAAERLRITSDGKVGLGTSSPDATLHISKSLTDGDTLLRIQPTSFSAGYSVRQAFTRGSTDLVRFTVTSDASNADKGSLTISTSSTTSTTNPVAVFTGDGRVGVGTTDASSLFSSSRNIRLSNTTGKVSYEAVVLDGSNNNRVGLFVDSATGDLGLDTGSSTGTYNGLSFYIEGSKKATIDRLGRLVVGTSSSPSAGTGQYALAVVQGYAGGATGEGILSIARGKVATSMVNTDTVGQIVFTDNAGNTFAKIFSFVDGTVSSTSDLPGALAFSTTADGSSSPTERMRIDSSGRLLIGTTAGTAPLTVAGTNVEVRNANGAYINNSQTTSVSTSATTIIDNAGFQGRLWVINGATGIDRFCDLVMASTSVAPVVVQSYTSSGAPAARTYTRSGSAVQLAMASGTYDVRCIGFGA